MLQWLLSMFGLGGGGGGGGDKPYVFPYQQGMEQFWSQFQNRLQNPPNIGWGQQSSSTDLSPPGLFQHLSQSPFGMWQQSGMPFLGQQQQTAAGMYGAEQGYGSAMKQQNFNQMLGSIGAALAMMLTMGGQGSTGGGGLGPPSFGI